MAEPLICIDCSTVRAGRLDQVRAAIDALVDFVHAHEPRVLGYQVFIDERTARMTVLQVHPDSASMEHHMAVAAPAFAGFVGLLDMDTMEIYGSPSPALVEAMQQKARMLGAAAVRVLPAVAGFTRFAGAGTAASGPAATRRPPRGSATLQPEPTMRIDLTSVMVDDQAKALAFYTEKLGFVKKLDVPMGEARWLTVVAPDHLDDVQLLLEPMAFPPAREYQKALRDAGIPAASFGVADVEHEYERMTALGVRFPSKPVQAGPVKVAVLDDTCGNLIQLHQAPGSGSLEAVP